MDTIVLSKLCSITLTFRSYGLEFIVSEFGTVASSRYDCDMLLLFFLSYLMTIVHIQYFNNNILLYQHHISRLSFRVGTSVISSSLILKRSFTLNKKHCASPLGRKFIYLLFLFHYASAS